MKKVEIKKYHGYLFVEFDGDAGVAWAVEEDEILPIMLACKKYLAEHPAKETREKP